MYKFVRSILFFFPPEWTHYFSMNCLKILCSIGFIKRLLARFFTPYPRNKSFTTHLFHLDFKNPIGIGAGFDKNARYLRELSILGFGFVEIGTVTPLPQEGNPKPRLFRLPKDMALINRMGFNNDGVKVVAQRLKKWKEKIELANQGMNVSSGGKTTGSIDKIIIGGNIGKNKVTPNEEAWKDYAICFTELHPYVDYFVVNVSSPNTPGLRELQEKEPLKKILLHLQMINNGKAQSKPILLKISPDLTQEQIDDVIDIAMEIKLDGIVATNTTIRRENLYWETGIGNQEAGGLSGLPLKKRSTDVLRYISRKTNNEIPLIASGGIFSASDAREKFEAGASLIQVWTGFIYEGPTIVKRLIKNLYDPIPKSSPSYSA